MDWGNIIMKNKIPSTFKDSLSFDWWKYLLTCIVFCVAWYYIYQSKDALKEYEIINIFTNTEIKKSDLFDDILSIEKQQDIKEIKINNVGDDLYTNTLLQSKGLLDGDIFIVYDKYIDSLLKDRSYKFDETFNNEINSINPNVEYLTYGENNIAVKLFDKEIEEYNNYFSINQYFEFKETTYMLINSKSSNADKDSNKIYSGCAFSVFLHILKGN